MRALYIDIDPKLTKFMPSTTKVFASIMNVAGLLSIRPAMITKATCKS